jgi:hypothetical protein
MSPYQLSQELDSSTLVGYQSTNPAGPGGMVSGRDFVILRRKKLIDGKTIVCYATREFSEVPPVPNYVRYV